MPMNVLPKPRYNGLLKVKLPASKSVSNRLLIIRALCKESFTIENLSKANDTVVLDRALRAYKGKENKIEINVADAGTAFRFITAYAATRDQQSVIDGSDRLRERPIKELNDALTQLGVEITYMSKQGFAPFVIRGGRLNKTELELPNSVSSQFLSALLLIAPAIGGLKVFFDPSQTSMSYVMLTASIMKECGAVVHLDNNSIIVDDSSYRIAKGNEGITVENDWSAASYWYMFVALGLINELKFEGLKEDSSQPDSILPQLMLDLGVKTVFRENNVIVSESGSLSMKNEYDLSATPDLIQTLVVLFALLDKKVVIHGTKTLPFKESDRIKALSKELKKVGVELEVLSENSILIDPKLLTIPDKLYINTHNDHRMAMAFSPLLFYTNVEFSDPYVVNKSYPGFWQEIKKLF